MTVVVLVNQVPDQQGDRKLNPAETRYAEPAAAPIYPAVAPTR
jgi:hypothetical protein